MRLTCLTGDADIVAEKAVTGLGIVAMRIEQGLGLSKPCQVSPARTGAFLKPDTAVGGVPRTRRASWP